MKEFANSQGVLMIQGTYFNWEKIFIYKNFEIPFVHKIHLLDVNGNSYLFMYNIDNKTLSLSSIDDTVHETYKFYCETLCEAEKITNSFIMANDIKLSHMYIKC